MRWNQSTPNDFAEQGKELREVFVSRTETLPRECDIPHPQPSHKLALALARTAQVHHDVDADLGQALKTLCGRLRAPIECGSHLAEARDALERQFARDGVFRSGGHRARLGRRLRRSSRAHRPHKQCKTTDSTLNAFSSPVSSYRAFQNSHVSGRAPTLRSLKGGIIHASNTHKFVFHLS